MGHTARPERRPRCPPDTRFDSRVSRAPVVDSYESRSNDHIDQPPKTYRPIGRKADRGRHTHSHSREHERHSSRAKSRLKDQQLYRRGGTLWEKSIGPAVFYEHREPQSGRLPGNEDRVSFEIGIDTKRHSTRAKLTLPKPPGQAYFTSSRQPRTSQDHSRSKRSGRQSGAQNRRTDDYHREVRIGHSDDARRDPRDRKSGGTRKSSRRDQYYYTAPRLTVDNVRSNARSASLSYLPDDTAVPTRPPLTAQATTRRRRTSRSEQKTTDPPASRVPNLRGENSRGETRKSSGRGDTYPRKPRCDSVSRGRRMERKHSKNEPIAFGDDRKEPAAYRSRSRTPDSPFVDRLSKPIHHKRRSSNEHPPIPKEMGMMSSPPTSDFSAGATYSVYETRRTVQRKQSQQTTCSCTVS